MNTWKIFILLFVLKISWDVFILEKCAERKFASYYCGGMYKKLFTINLFEYGLKFWCFKISKFIQIIFLSF